jgi:RES domain-containing protein
MILTALGPLVAYRMHMPKWAAMPASSAGTVGRVRLRLARALVQSEHEPPSWVLADEAITAGAKGILFALAVEPGGANLVIYTHQLDPQDQLEVRDPAVALPKNQDSWR